MMYREKYHSLWIDFHVISRREPSTLFQTGFKTHSLSFSLWLAGSSLRLLPAWTAAWLFDVALLRRAKRCKMLSRHRRGWANLFHRRATRLDKFFMLLPREEEHDLGLTNREQEPPWISACLYLQAKWAPGSWCHVHSVEGHTGTLQRSLPDSQKGLIRGPDHCAVK